MSATSHRCRACFPDYPAPVVRNSGGEREMMMMRWGMPPRRALAARRSRNIRNTSSSHWRGSLKPRTGALSRPTALPSTRRKPKPGDEEKGRGVVRAQQ